MTTTMELLSRYFSEVPRSTTLVALANAERNGDRGTGQLSHANLSGTVALSPKNEGHGTAMPHPSKAYPSVRA